MYGQGTKNDWLWNSAITPSTVNDLVLNVTAFAQSYAPCCDATDEFGGQEIGDSGSINAGRLLTNGLTQNQVGATGAPPTPTSPAAAIVNSNFVNFTFTANNNGVVHYLLQREDVTPGTVSQPWVTVAQDFPASNSYTTTQVPVGVSSLTTPVIQSSSVAPTTVTIQDAMPIAGNTYIYRVAAVDFDGTTLSNPTGVIAIPKPGPSPFGVEIHMYNGRPTDQQLATQFQAPMNRIPAEYRAQTARMSFST